MYGYVAARVISIYLPLLFFLKEDMGILKLLLWLFCSLEKTFRENKV